MMLFIYVIIGVIVAYLYVLFLCASVKHLICFYIDGDLAISAFEILGTNANAAIPELTILFNKTNNAILSRRALMALSLIGESSFPILTNAFANTNRPGRRLLLNQIFWMAPMVGTNAVLPTMHIALSDPDPNVRKAGTDLLHALVPETITNNTAEPSL
jgi:hypothetical protein